MKAFITLALILFFTLASNAQAAQKSQWSIENADAYTTCLDEQLELITENEDCYEPEEIATQKQEAHTYCKREAMDIKK